MARPAPMNRIKELREAAGMSLEDLAAVLGTSRQHVARHERGERRLTIQWINRYAVALEVAPADIMAAPELADVESEIEPATIDGMPQLSRLIGSRGLSVYRVVKSRLTTAGIEDGALVMVDATPAAIAAMKPGDAVVVRLTGSEILLLRQIIPPSLLVTNEPGPHNAVMRLDDRSIAIEIVGVAIRDTTDGH